MKPHVCPIFWSSIVEQVAGAQLLVDISVKPPPVPAAGDGKVRSPVLVAESREELAPFGRDYWRELCISRPCIAVRKRSLPGENECCNCLPRRRLEHGGTARLTVLIRSSRRLLIIACKNPSVIAPRCDAECRLESIRVLYSRYESHPAVERCNPELVSIVIVRRRNLDTGSCIRSHVFSLDSFAS